MDIMSNNCLIPLSFLTEVFFYEFSLNIDNWLSWIDLCFEMQTRGITLLSLRQDLADPSTFNDIKCETMSHLAW